MFEADVHCIYNLWFLISACPILPEPAWCQHCTCYATLSHFLLYHRLLVQVRSIIAFEVTEHSFFFLILMLH
jgi:hypothetical protein